MAFTYRKATEADRDRYIDFANLVFSMAHQPHNFKALLPKVYGDGRETAHMQNLALDDSGNVRGLVAVMPNEMRVLGETLKTGYVGTVSVHPYARGEGHMKKLMQMAIDGMREQGCDLSLLGGQRQRYEYFGYTRGGVCYSYTVTSTNVRHALSQADADAIEIRDIAPDDTASLQTAHALHSRKPLRGARTPGNFHEIATSWMAKLMGVYRAGAMVGYMVVGTNGDSAPIVEMALEDYALTGAVIKKHLAQTGAKGCEIGCAEFDVALRKELAQFAEYSSVEEAQQLLVFDFPKVLRAFFKLKASFARLEDGRKSYLIDGQPVTITVQMNEVTVTAEAGEDAVPLTAMDAQYLFFGRDGWLFGESLPLNWAPLPLFLDNADGF